MRIQGNCQVAPKRTILFHQTLASGMLRSLLESLLTDYKKKEALTTSNSYILKFMIVLHGLNSSVAFVLFNFRLSTHIKRKKTKLSNVC